MRLSNFVTSFTSGIRKCSPGAKFESTISPPIDLIASWPSLTVNTLARTMRMKPPGAMSIQDLGLHQRTPRARAGSSSGETCTSGMRVGGTVSVSLGFATAGGPGEISLSSGRYIMLLAPLVSTITLREFL